MQKNKSALIAIFSFFIVGLLAPLSYAMEPREDAAEEIKNILFVSTHSPSDKSPLLSKVTQKKELLELRRDHRKLINSRLSDLQKIFGSALVLYPSDFDSSDKTQLSSLGYHILSDFDETFFDLTQTPRAPLSCLPLWFLEGIQGINGLVGGAVISLSMTEYTNGILEPIFKWPAGGAIAWSVLGVSIFFHAPVAVVLFYEGAKDLFQKKKMVFQPRLSSEKEGNTPYARAFSKSNSYRALQTLLFASATTYGMIPTLAWFAFDEALPFQIIIPPYVLYYFAAPYVRIGLEVLDKWYSETFQTTAHHTRETRRALVVGLSDIEKALCGDNVGKLTQYIWKLLAERTGNFGKNSQNKVSQGQLFSALSALISMPYNIEREEGVSEKEKNPDIVHYNRTTAMNRIDEPSLREKAANFSANIFTGAVSATGFFSESALLGTVLGKFGVSQEATDVIAYPVATFAQTRGLFENEIHRRNFLRFPLPVSGEKDFSYVRAAVSGGNALFYGALGGLLFYGITYHQLEDFPSPARELMAALQGLRYFSLFFYMGSRQYNQVFTSFKMRNTETPSLSDKKSQIIYFIREAKKIIRYDLDDETIAELGRSIWNTN